MTKYFFYTEYDKLKEQTSDDAFGSISTVGADDEFRITNIHKPFAVGTSLRAFAITKSIVAGQIDSNNTNLVNLILKPLNQPEFSYARIRYVIYKGIKKSSLVGPGPDFHIVNTTDLGKQLIAEQTLANDQAIAAAASAIPPDPPPTPETADQKALGLHLDVNAPISLGSFADTDPIDNLFYRENTDHTFTTVKGGMYIGDFDETEFGIDIVLDAAGYQAPLSITREQESRIKVTKIVASPTDRQIIEHRIQKEECLYYTDPCSLFGTYFKKYKFIAKTVDGTQTEIEEKISGDDVYNLVLLGTQHTQPVSGDTGTFYNRNRVTLDVRNGYNYSYNLFNNYMDDFVITYDGGTTELTKDYYSNDWPYYYLDSSDFPTGNTSNKNEFHLRLARKREGEAYNWFNDKPLVFLSQGYTKNFRERKGKKKFIEVFKDNDEVNYTDLFSIVVPNYENSGETRVVASYVKLRLLRLTTERKEDAENTSLVHLNSLDYMFAPLSLKNVYNSSDNFQSRVYEDEFFVDMIKDRGRAFTAVTGVAKDANNTTFFAYAQDSYAKKLSVRKGFNIVGESSDSYQSFDHYLSLKYPHVSFWASNLVEGGNTLYRLESERKLSVKGISSPDMSEMILLNIDNASLQAIETDIVNHIPTFLDEFKVYFTLSEGEHKLDDNGKQYIEYDLLVSGFVIDSGTSEIRIETMNTTKKIIR